ncbi:MAG TPA: NAD(P)/FAD-dependent oxidoreductase [Vicinamibacterales bacterium]|nr:NAD(P)/FAD-dependent oxidoreductase [Vicinamibacterales bacterium]
MITCAVCVVGGGPAGTTAARRLAQHGHDVCLVDRGRFQRRHATQSLPPSILPLLGQLGLRDRIEDAGFRRPDRSLIRWGASGAFAKDASPECGFLVDRDRFDTVLLDAARDAGVRVLQPATVVRVESSDGGSSACLRDGTRVRARFLVDAAGRSGVLPRGRVLTPLSTMALYAYWDDSAIDGGEPRIESGESAWYWGALLRSGVFCATVFVDGRRCRGLTRPAREAFYHDLIRESTLLAPCVRGRLLGPVRACDASPFVDARPVADSTIKVGEAAFAVDPLSSQGVQIAMRSALHAAAVVHTSVHLPDRAALARRFYRERIADAAAHHATLTCRAYAAAGASEANEFWSARSAELRGRSAPALRADTVADAVVLSPLARVQSSPVLDGEVICEGAVIAHPNLDRAVAFLNGVPVAPLVRAASIPRHRDALLIEWMQHAPPPVCRQILGWLWQRGVLEDARQYVARRLQPSVSS